MAGGARREETMKKLMALVTALLLICTLVGCGGAPLKKPSEQDTLALLRQEIADSGSQCGVAYLGYMPDGGDVPAWLADNGWTQTFPFLSDLTEQQVVTQEGGEVYCIVPAEKNARVTVEAYDAFNETDPLGDVLYDSAEGAPICLRGNVSEIMGNLRVTVETAAGQAVYFPSLSLRDGSVSTLTEQGRVYNFTPGAIHGAPQIRELYSEDFDYTDSVGNTGHYTYRVPRRSTAPLSGNTAPSWRRRWRVRTAVTASAAPISCGRPTSTATFCRW